MSLSTHVLDTMTGRPAVGVRIRLDGARAGVTDEDGRLRLPAVAAGVHRLGFDTADYFAERGVPSFHSEVIVAFTVEDPDRHYHVPLLAGPYSYTTYLGS